MGMPAEPLTHRSLYYLGRTRGKPIEIIVCIVVHSRRLANPASRGHVVVRLTPLWAQKMGSQCFVLRGGVANLLAARLARLRGHGGPPKNALVLPSQTS